MFRLEAGADTAYGDVVMIPRQRREARLPVQDPSTGLPIPRTVEVLTIAFVRATDGGLSGRLTPYRDPECDCVLDTRFQGRIRGEPQLFGDVVIARKDTPTSYHLAVTVDDHLQGVTLVTRGTDLFANQAAQIEPPLLEFLEKYVKDADSEWRTRKSRYDRDTTPQ